MTQIEENNGLSLRAPSVVLGSVSNSLSISVLIGKIELNPFASYCMVRIEWDGAG